MRAATPCLLSVLLFSSISGGIASGAQAASVETGGLLSRVNIFAADDRVEVAQDVRSEYSAVGYLEVPVPASVCGTAGHAPHQQGEGCFKGGTAFLVSARHILTSAHLAFAADVRDMGRHRTSTFWAGRHAKGKATPVAWGRYTPTEYRDTEDWALLELDRPLGRRFGWIGLQAVPARAAARDDFKVMSLGFPQDIQRGGRRLMLDPDCRILTSALVWNSWPTDCATRRGNSGGPVVRRDGGRLYAIAIVSGSRGETNGVVSRWSGVRTNVAVPIAAVLPAIAPIIGPDQVSDAARRETSAPASASRVEPPF